MIMYMNGVCICYEECMNARCCRISTHIHLEEDADVLLEDFWLLFGDGTDGEKENFDSSDALSDHVLGLDVVEDLIHRPCWGESGRYSTGDLACKSCWRVNGSCRGNGLEESRARWNLWLGNKRGRFPPMHYLTKFQVWILLLPGKWWLLRNILLEDSWLLLGDEVGGDPAFEREERYPWFLWCTIWPSLGPRYCWGW